MKRLVLAATWACVSFVSPLQAQNLLTVDATAPTPKPESSHLKMGASVSASGATLTVNNQYLLRDGKPWLPVMGEFHYSRYPGQEWEPELLKMKAAGIDVVASYIIWNHHEAEPGHFNWSGDRDLRRFAQLCAKHGLYFYPRIGPWAHAEVRFGGIPDWVVDALPTRGNDPGYMTYVTRWYEQIGLQLQGLMFKDGGPVVGVQLENEYNRTGPGQGREHIAALKQLALKAGFDLPLYTVTGWDRTVYPRGEVLPVFGSYVDEPWTNASRKLPPRESYLFRFGSRVGGNLGAQTENSGRGDADPDMPLTPFLGAEYGPGVPAMYQRRPIIYPADIASMIAVQLGSGVNLIGYYMFHGGRNPSAIPRLQESTDSGGVNDLPAINYDFQAPLGQYGQAHEVLAWMRPFHLFLHGFGDRLAPMTVRQPEQVPAKADDLKTPRWSVRSQGDSGFVFFSNHVRQYDMPRQQALRFEVRLPGGTLQFPSKPVDVANDTFFIWPFNLDLDGARLVYASAQPVTRIETEQGPLYVFAVAPGVAPEFAFDAASVESIRPASGKLSRQGGRYLLSNVKPGTALAFTAKTRQGKQVRALVLNDEQSRQLSVGTVAGRERLVLTAKTVWFDQDGALELRSIATPDFKLGLYPALAAMPQANLTLREGKDGLFQSFSAQAAARAPTLEQEQLRKAQPMPGIEMVGAKPHMVQPRPELFGRAAAWRLKVPGDAMQGLSNVWLSLDYHGDIARLFSEAEMIDDEYFNGSAWQIGLSRFADRLQQPLTLNVLPLRADSPAYIQEEVRPKMAADQQLAELVSAKLIPEYGLRITP